VAMSGMWWGTKSDIWLVLERSSSSWHEGGARQSLTLAAALDHLEVQTALRSRYCLTRQESPSTVREALASFVRKFAEESELRARAR